MDICIITRCFALRAYPLSSCRSYRRYAVDYDGQSLCKIIYIFHWHVGQCSARVPVSCAGKNCARSHISCVFSHYLINYVILNDEPETGMQILELGLPESSSKPLTRRVIYDRFHHLLQNLLALIPTLTSTLQLLLVRNFPHKRLALAAHVTYIRNVLRIAEYCPELADRILSTIVDRAIQIDVRF